VLMSSFKRAVAAPPAQVPLSPMVTAESPPVSMPAAAWTGRGRYSMRVKFEAVLEVAPPPPAQVPESAVLCSALWLGGRAAPGVVVEHPPPRVTSSLGEFLAVGLK